MLDPYIEGWKLRELLRKREIRPREAAEFFLARIEKLNPALGAFVTVTPERALADADRLEKLSRSDADALPLFEASAEGTRVLKSSSGTFSTGPVETITARSITFCNSRILPGQS